MLLSELNFKFNRNNDKIDDAEINNIIYDAYLFNIIPPFKKFILLLISIFLSIFCIFSIGEYQYNEYNKFVNGKLADLNETVESCNNLNYANINIISTSSVIPLLILYILMFKRRVFLSRMFKYRNIGLPMIVSCWNKSDRLFTSLTYGVIAFNVYLVVRDTLNAQVRTLSSLIIVDDPTGLLKLIVKIIEVLLIGISNFNLILLNFHLPNNYVLIEKKFYFKNIKLFIGQY